MFITNAEKIPAEKISEPEAKISDRLKAIHENFNSLEIDELEGALLVCTDRNEKVLYRTLLNLKMQIDQEKIINQTLL